MIRRRHLQLILATGAALCLAPVRDAGAQVGTGSNLGTVNLTASKGASLTVSIPVGGTQSIAQVTDGVVNPFPTPVQIHTQWNLSPSQSSGVAVVAYFTTPSQAMVNGTDYIPSSRILGRVTTGTPTTFTPITQGAVVGIAETVGTAGGSLLLFTQPITGSTKMGTRTDNLDLQLDLRGTKTRVGTYTGTLHIRAVVQ